MKRCLPDVISLRRQAIPGSWSNDKQSKRDEANLVSFFEHDAINAWKDLAKRFKNGKGFTRLYSFGHHSGRKKKKAPCKSCRETAKPHIRWICVMKRIANDANKSCRKKNWLKDLGKYLCDSWKRPVNEVQCYLSKWKAYQEHSFSFIVTLGSGRVLRLMITQPAQ